MVADRRITVFGAGAVGCHLGAHLARATVTPPLHVTLVGRPKIVEAIRNRGVTVDESGERATVRVDAVESPAALPQQDAVMLTVRTFDVATAITDLQHLLGARGVLLAFQNGIGAEEMLATQFGRERVLACTSTVSVGMEEAGIVSRYSRRGGIALATLNGSAVPTWIVEAFTATGLPTVTVEDYRALRWSKLLLNMLGASTTAILDMDITETMENDGVFRLEQLAFREAGRVMDAQSIRTVALPGYPVPLARLLMRLPRPLAQRSLGRRTARARSGRSPSMRADMHRGRTEAEAFSGAVVEAGRRAGVTTPANAVLTALTVELARDSARRARFKGKPEALVEYARAHDVHI